MLVLCIRDDWDTDYGPLPAGSPIRGQVYTVITEHEKMGRKFYLLWESPPCPGGGRTVWLTSYFKPCRSTDISSLKKIRKRVLEDA